MTREKGIPAAVVMVSLATCLVAGVAVAQVSATYHVSRHVIEGGGALSISSTAVAVGAIG